MTLKHCQPRQIEASTAVEKTCKLTKHFFWTNQFKTPTQTKPRIIIIISPTDGDKKCNDKSTLQFSLRHFKRIWFLTTFDTNKRIENKCCYYYFFFFLSKTLFHFFLGKNHLLKYFGWVRTFNTPVKSSH